MLQGRNLMVKQRCVQKLVQVKSKSVYVCALIYEGEEEQGNLYASLCLCYAAKEVQANLYACSCDESEIVYTTMLRSTFFIEISLCYVGEEEHVDGG